MVNIERRTNVPNSLLKRQKYNSDDVLSALEEDFHNKCYLCECKATSLNVEHLKSQHKYPQFINEWTNLFLSCTHCNQCKRHHAKFDDIMNCTDPTQDVEIWISYRMKNDHVYIQPEIDDLSVNNTAELLDLIYNGNYTKDKEMESKNLREHLTNELRKFTSKIKKWKK